MRIMTTRREAGKLLMAGLSTLTADAADTTIPMQASRWEVENGEFVQHKGVAALKIPTPAKAVLKDLVFGDGRSSKAVSKLWWQGSSLTLPPFSWSRTQPRRF